MIVDIPQHTELSTLLGIHGTVLFTLLIMCFVAYTVSNVLHNCPGRKVSDCEWSGSSLEICAPATSDVEFKYSWPIDNFIQQVNQLFTTEDLLKILQETKIK